MNKLDVIKTLEQDMFTLNSAAAAMYRIREPVGSTRLAFDQISSNKQARNRELALQTLTAVFEKFPEPTEISDPKVVSEFLAEQMYRTLSPRKSEQFPFDQRTPYARSYYRDTADRFLENFLLPLAEASRQSHEAMELKRHDSRSVDRAVPSGPTKQAQLESRKPVTRSLDSGHNLSLPKTSSLPSSPTMTSGQTIQTSKSHSDSTLGTSSSSTQSSQSESQKVESPPSRSGSPKAGSQGGVLSLIAILLFVIAVLLVVIVIRTF